MTADDVLAELLDRYSRPTERYQPNPHRLTAADVRRWSNGLGISTLDFYDCLAARLALEFHASTLTFEFCDAVVNDIHAVITLNDEERSDLFWDVFLAFDAGEFYPDGDRSRDPVDTYTRPQIARVVERLSNPPSGA